MMSASGAGGSDEDIVQVDPFEVSKPMANETDPIMKNPPSGDTGQAAEGTSQTTKSLRTFLESSEVLDKPTQAIGTLACECGCKTQGNALPLKMDIVQCKTCGSSVHKVCYLLPAKSTLPACISCCAKNLGGIPLHANIRVLMLLRIWLKMLSFLKDEVSVKGVHLQLGLGAEDESLMAQIVSILLQRHILNPMDPDQRSSKSRVIEFDIDGIVHGIKPVPAGASKWLLGSELRLRTDGPGRDNYRDYRDFRDLVEKATKGMGTCSDESLDQICWQLPQAGTRQVDSSDIEEQDDITAHFSSVKFESSEESIDCSFQTPLKRREDTLEPIEDDTLPSKAMFASSNPIKMSPRWKKRNVSNVFVGESFTLNDSAADDHFML